jgi:putative two-component system response regulator
MVTSPTNPATILIVDDTPNNLSLLNAALSDEYRVRVATNGKQALDLAGTMPVDLILLDIMMPGMDGFETCRRLKDNPMTRSIPVIFVTARGEVADESRGFACGAVDYINKPVRAPIVKARVKTHLALFDQNRILEERVRQRTEELVESRNEILRRLGSAGEYRDNDTGLHVTRVCHYSRLIALAYGLPETEAELLFNAAALHDVGKIAIPDSILFKNGRLNAEEWQVVKSHCEIGANIIGEHQSELLTTAATVALTHHERWDGTGYPRGLRGTAIPLFGRIVAVADVFDALTSERPYKIPWSVADAVHTIREDSGAQFDPDVVTAFVRIIRQLTEIKETCSDGARSSETFTAMA